jgi:tRNA(Ile)-lysidine synthase
MGPAPAVAAVRLGVRRSLADLEPGDVVLVACSGGADSVALAAALSVEAPRLGLRAGGLTVDHGLQAGSDGRAAQVAAALRELGLDPVEVLTVSVAGEGGPEAAARTSRYAAMAAAAERLGAAAVLLGHTRDDQAETVLLGLSRGSGARSLAGMSARSGLYRRPLLDLDRSTVRAAAAGLSVWDDPHNADPAFARSRVRHTALPVLEETLGPWIAAALARSADLLRADADALDGWAAASGEAVRRADGSLDTAALLELPGAVRSRVVRAALLHAGCRATDLGSVHVAAVDALVTTWHGQGPLQLPGGVGVRRECGRLLISCEEPAAGPAATEGGGA